MPETEKETTSSHAPMDAKKKKIIVGASAFGILVLGYLWYRNKNSSASATPVTGAGITSYVAPTTDPNATPSSSSSTTPSITIDNTSQGGAGGYGGAGGNVTVMPGNNGGGTITKKPVHKVNNKGGKTHIGVPVHKPATHVSGGTIKKSGSTSTGRPLKIATHPATVRHLPASHSGNFVVPHNIKK